MDIGLHLLEGNVVNLKLPLLAIEKKRTRAAAQIVMARGKKRFIYDFNVMLDIEVITDDLRGDGEEGKGSSCSKDEYMLLIINH